MTRLNQKRRQRIGFVYLDQVQNDVQMQPKQRQLLTVQEKNFTQNMTGTIAMGGNGCGCNGDGLSLAGSGLSLAGAGLSLAGSGHLKQNIDKAVSRIRFGTETMGSQLGKRAELIQETKDRLEKPSGMGLKLAGQGCMEDTLPGERLRKKILRTLLKVRRKKISGGSRATGQSMSKTLPGMKAHKLNPRPLVGAGQEGGFIIALSALIAGLSSAAIAAAQAAALGAAGALGAIAVTKIAGGGGVKDALRKTIQSIKITAKDLPGKVKAKLKNCDRNA